jgi:hypothetical protein
LPSSRCGRHSSSRHCRARLHAVARGAKETVAVARPSSIRALIPPPIRASCCGATTPSPSRREPRMLSRTSPRPKRSARSIQAGAPTPPSGCLTTTGGRRHPPESATTPTLRPSSPVRTRPPPFRLGAGAGPSLPPPHTPSTKACGRWVGVNGTRSHHHWNVLQQDNVGGGWPCDRPRGPGADERGLGAVVILGARRESGPGVRTLPTRLTPV